MIKVKDGYAKLIGTTYAGSSERVLLSNGGDFGLHTDRNNEANKLVRTDASGYILAGWINTTSGDMETTAITRIYCSNDNFIRYKTPANFFSSLTNSGDNISITVASQNRTLTVLYANIASQLRSRGTIAPLTGRTLNLGDVYSYHLNESVSGGPTTYAAVIGFGRGALGTVEIAGEWASGRGLWVRALRDTTDNWYTWDKILTLATYTEITDSRYYTKTLSDERFVNITGDTMVGTLHMKPTTEDYTEGIRLYGTEASNTWSNIHFGCDPSSSSGTHTNQWILGRNPSNNFVLDRGNNTGANGFVVTTTGNFGLGTTSPGYKLHVTGDIYTTAGIISKWAFINTGDSTLKVYDGKITDAKSDGNICLQTSIDGTDGQSHEYPTQHGWRCNLVLQPRGGQVYIGTNPDGGNEGYKLYVNGNVYSSGSLTVQTGGIWVQGGSSSGGNVGRMSLVDGMPNGLAYNTSRGVRIYSNAIAFADPYNGNSNNDAGWIRHIEETANSGQLEIAVGDDNINETIVVRRYNTSSAVGKELYLFNSAGDSTFPGNVGIGTTSPSYKLHVNGAGVFSNTNSITYNTNGITIGAGDTTYRYITCYGKTGSSYINIGYSASQNNCGELSFYYDGNNNTSNCVLIGLYGGQNWFRVYPSLAKLNSSLEIYSTGDSFNEGLRIHSAPNNWCGLVMCGPENTGSVGTSVNTWGIHNNEGKLYINKNGASAHTGYELCNINGNWGIGTNDPRYKLHVDGTVYASGKVVGEAEIYTNGYVFSNSGWFQCNKAGTGLYNAAGDARFYYEANHGGWNSDKRITAPAFYGPLYGNASTATSAGNADTLDGYHASSLWRSDGAVWNQGANVSLNASGNNQEWSFDITRNGHTGCYWHVWDSSLNTMLKVNADNGKVYAPYNFVGNLEGYASSAGNSDTVDGYHVNANSSTPYGLIPVVGLDGVIELGKYIDFHNDNTTASDFSTRLLCAGNYSNIVTLPSTTGTLALTSQIPTVERVNYGSKTITGATIYWDIWRYGRIVIVNGKISSSGTTNTTLVTLATGLPYCYNYYETGVTISKGGGDAERHIVLYVSGSSFYCLPYNFNGISTSYFSFTYISI